MLALSGGAKIFLCHGATDLRKGFEGLSALVASSIEEPLTGNAYFIFLNKTRDRMKVPYFDIDGLAIWYKRLEKGRFPKRDMQNGRRLEFLPVRSIFLMLKWGNVYQSTDPFSSEEI
jgi:transposase